MASDEALVRYGKQSAAELDAKTWRDESHLLAVAVTYDPEIILALRKADALTEAPYRGRKVPEVNDEQLREIPASAWRILYHVRQEQVFIVTLIHKRREPSAEDINSGSAQNE